MAKKAKFTIIGVEGTCPYCDGPLIDPNYHSFLLHIREYPEDQLYPCQDCGKESMLMAKAYS